MSPPSYPPPKRERSTSSYLLLGVNLLVLAGAIWWIAYKIQSADGPQPNGGTDTGEVGAGGIEGGRGGTKIDLPPSRSGARPWDPSQTPGGAAVGSGGGGAGGTGAPSGPEDNAVDRDKDPVRQEARAAMDAVGVHVEVVRSLTMKYPSSARDFGANRGIEALYQLMDERQMHIDAPTGDTDADGRPELLDPWGRAYVYFSHDDYGNKQEWTLDGTSLAVSPRTADGGYHARERFQLWSAGPNGVNDKGRGDDVTSWVSRR